MHVIKGREHRHHDLTCHLILCQVASSLRQLGIQVTAQSKLLDHIDAFIVLEGSIDLDNAWVLQGRLQLNLPCHLQCARTLFFASARVTAGDEQPM